ncbi:MAG: DAK2 domain-containing protein, partial [Bacilli bacterium]
MNNQQVKEMLITIANMYISKENELSQLDALIGDGDHGISMARGATFGLQAIQEMDNESIENYFKTYGRTLIFEIGGAIGPLFGSIITEFAKVCKGQDDFNEKLFLQGCINACDKVMDLGNAKRNDKTMVDVMLPVQELGKEMLENDDIDLNKVKECAYEALKATIPMQARKGRSQY